MGSKFGDVKRFQIPPQDNLLTSTTGAGPLLAITECGGAFGAIIQLVNAGALTATISASMDGVNFPVISVFDRGAVTGTQTRIAAFAGAGLFYVPLGYMYVKMDQTVGAAATTGSITFLSESMPC